MDCNNVLKDINTFNRKAKEAKQIFKALEQQMYLPEDGTFGDVFLTLIDNTSWLCKLCIRTLSRSEMASHTQDSNHQFLNEHHKVIYKKYYETKPVVMDECDEAEPSTNYELLKALNRTKDEPLLGVEYILEILNKNKKRCFYICTLCSNMKCAPVEHLSSTCHTMMYVKRHFKTAHKHFGTNKVAKIKKGHKLVLNKLAKAIESTYGRLKPYQIKVPEHFAFDRTIKIKRTIKAVKRGQHFTESDGQTFEDLVMKELGIVLPQEPSEVVDNVVSSTQGEPSTAVVEIDQPNIKNEVEDKSQLPSFDLHNEENVKGGHNEQLAESKDPSIFYYKQEWKENPDENVLKLHYEEIESKIEAKEMLGSLNEPIFISSSPPAIHIDQEVILLDGNDDDSRNYTRKRSRSLSSMSIDSSKGSHTNRVLPTSREDSPSRRSNSLSRIKYSPSPLRYSPSSRNKDSSNRYCPSRRYSPSPRRYSPLRRRYCYSRRTDSSSPDRDHPFGRRNSPCRRDSPSTRRDPPSRCRNSPFRRRYSRSRSRDFPRRYHSPFSCRYSACRRIAALYRRDSPSTRRDPPFRRRDSPIRRRSSRSRSRESALRARISPSRRRESPSHRRNPRSRRRDSPLRRRESPRRNHSPSRRRDKKKSDCPEILTDRLGRRSRSIGESSEIPSKRTRDYHDEQSDTSENIDINLVAILGMLATLGDELGLLGPKVIGLLSVALEMENEKLNSSEDLLNNRDNYVIFKTSIRNLKGLHKSGLLDEAQKTKLKKIKRYAKPFIKRYKQKKIKKGQQWDNGLVLPAVGVEDKENISMGTINTLLAQGKSDIILEKLDKVIQVFESNGGQQSTTGSSTDLESCQKESTSKDTNEVDPSIPQSTSEINKEEIDDISRLEEKRMVELKKLEDTRLLVNSLMGNQQNSLSILSKTEDEELSNSTDISGAYIQCNNNQQFLRSVIASHQVEQKVNMGGFKNLLKKNYKYISNFQKPSSRQKGN